MDGAAEPVWADPTALSVIQRTVELVAAFVYAGQGGRADLKGDRNFGRRIAPAESLQRSILRR